MEVKKYIDKFVTTVYDFYLYETDNYNTLPERNDYL